jgi:hypothetical protein
MNRQLCVAAFALGLAAVAWVGHGYLGANPLALTMTALIAVAYVLGALELRRFHEATASLRLALAAIPESLPNLGDWLGRVHTTLQNPVRLRIEGERVALPGPAMTPYLVGLLVLLGMLGTFLGMVVTLNGAVQALESTSDLPAMRAALAAPVKGLGLAFGTSIAGVAASAMLGLMSALCRRERLQASQALDSAIASPLRVHSRTHQRQETLRALQSQGAALPEVAQQLQALMAQMERQSQALNTQLLAQQDRFQHHAQTAYADLAASVDRTLQRSLTEGVRAAGAVVQPVVVAAMAGMASESTALRDALARTVEGQLDGLAARWGDTANALQRESAANDQQRLAAYTQTLDAMNVSLQRRWEALAAQGREQQAQICKTLEQSARDIHVQAETQARNTIAELTGLVQSVAEAPRLAAEVMGELRLKLSDSMARDNELLAERSRILAGLNKVLDEVRLGATEQRAASTDLVASAAATLSGVGTAFAAQVDGEAAKLAAVSAQLTAGAIEVSSLGEAFGFGVQRFSASSDGLIATLQRIETALGKSTVRSDEQLAYFVAQAREIIDLSILSQKQIVDDLQRLASKPAPRMREAV